MLYMWRGMKKGPQRLSILIDQNKKIELLVAKHLSSFHATYTFRRKEFESECFRKIIF